MVVEEDIDQYTDQGNIHQGSPIMTYMMSCSPESEGMGGHVMDGLIIYFAAIKNISSTLYGKEVQSFPMQSQVRRFLPLIWICSYTLSALMVQ